MNESNENIIKLSGITKVYPNGHRALSELDLTIKSGEFVHLVGESGAGKSTLIKLLHREQVPSKGKIEVLGIDLHKVKENDICLYRRRLGIVFQDFRLIENKTVYDNVAFVLKAHEVKRRDIKERVKTVLKAVNLLNKQTLYPSQLSGGEQQRVSIARAIVGKPDIIVADEPTGNLDSKNARNIIGILQQLNELGITVVVATHDRNVLQYANGRIIYLKNGFVIKDEYGKYDERVLLS